MQLREQASEVVSSGLQRARNFNIKVDATAFRLLADNLYSNKILAVVREYTTNAIDSHIAAGNPEPVRVHFPTPIEPWFAVEDDGIGLSDEDAMSLFSTYFESTKRDTNEQTGCFGLGSKSAFAYGDAFTVTSRFNGVIRTYACALDAGIPSISLLSENETDRPNGVEIKIPIAAHQDMNKFQDVGRRIFPWLRGSVTVNNSSCNMSRPDPRMSGKNWAYYPPSDCIPSSFMSGFCVNYGGILYEIDVSKLSLASSFARSFSLFSANRLILDIPGSEAISVQTSRESLSFDPETLETVRKYFHVAMAEARLTCQVEIDARPDFNSAFRYAYSMNLVDSELFTYKGVPLKLYSIDLSTTRAAIYTTEGYRKTIGPRNLLRTVSVRDMLTRTKKVCVVDTHASLSRLKRSFSDINIFVTMPYCATKQERQSESLVWEEFFREWCSVDTIVFSSQLMVPGVVRVGKYTPLPDSVRCFKYNQREAKLQVRPTRIPISDIPADAVLVPYDSVSEKDGVLVGKIRVPWSAFEEAIAEQTFILHNDDISLVKNAVTHEKAWANFVKRLTSKNFLSECVHAATDMSKYDLEFFKSVFVSPHPYAVLVQQVQKGNGYRRIISQLHTAKLLEPLTGINLDPIKEQFDSIYENYPLLQRRSYGTIDSAYKEYVESLDLKRAAEIAQ